MYRVDGEPTDQVPADDRGLQFGDGLFETIAVVGGRPALLDEHLERLQQDAARLGLPTPDGGALAAEARDLARHAPGCGVLKILLTAGSGGRGYLRPEPVCLRRILSLHPRPPYPQWHWDTGIPVAVTDVRLAEQQMLGGIKHLNRLEQTLARRAWSQGDWGEGLVRDAGGHVIEGTMSNVFAVRNGRLVTPALSRCGVAGVMRGAIMRHLLDQSRPVAETSLSTFDLASADEVFVCNSVVGVWPVTRIGETPAPGRGEVIASLQEWIDAEALACTPHCCTMPEEA